MKNLNIFKQFFLIFPALIFLVFIGYLVYFTFQISAPADSDSAEIFFVVNQGEGVNQISRDLKNSGLIRSSWDFETYVWLKRTESNFQAGEYRLRKNMNIREVTEFLTSSQAIPNEKTIKIIEGWTAAEIGEYLEKEGITTKKEFLETVQNFDTSMYDFLKDKPFNADSEGFLFPDTYRIYKDATAEDIIKKMLDNFGSKMTAKTREDIKQQGRTIFEIVSLASIIEKEVPGDNDRQLVADVFYKRLKIGQPLESCATIAYILAVNKKQYTIEDTRTESPYNTYLHKGLPPGPIGNPGLSAIKAAIYPKENDYWYFLSTENGETIFSKTLEEHNYNKAKYLQ